MIKGAIGHIHPSWLDKLKLEIKKPYFDELSNYIEKECKNETIYPSINNIFKAFNTPFNKIKVVIIGQDPYHGKNQANGLSFSVNKGEKIPPSLKNIFKELKTDLNKEIPNHGDLTQWSEQGVFLLNATLTVKEKSPGSHQNKGWETFTDKCIEKLSQDREGIVFLLWGNYAKQKSTLINQQKHYILETTHPSPFSAHRGFLGCKHFSKTNDLLKQQNKPIISW